jgi:hypothetical protein
MLIAMCTMPDGNACTIEGYTGSAAMCNVMCTHNLITMCVGGDGCCPPGCNMLSDSDCSGGPTCTPDAGPGVCGDGCCQAPETCCTCSMDCGMCPPSLDGGIAAGGC